MAVNLKNVKDTVNLAAEVLGAAAAVIEGAKQLGVDVDAVGGAVKDAAGGAANGARVVADGIGKGVRRGGRWRRRGSWRTGRCCESVSGFKRSCRGS